MKKIISWVAGSFFRQAGRFLFFIVIGGLIFLLIQHNNIQFKWTDLLGIETVKASEWESVWISPTVKYQINNGSWYNTSVSADNYHTITGVSGSAKYRFLFTSQKTLTSSQELLYFTTKLSYYQQTESGGGMFQGCTRWEPYNNGWSCTQIQSSFVDDSQQYIDPIFSITFSYRYNVNGTVYYKQCLPVASAGNSFTFRCPNTSNAVDGVEVSVFDAYGTIGTYSVGVYYLYTIEKSDAQSIIDNQNQNQNETISTITDTNTTNDSDNTASFFNETNTTSESALTSIVSAPVALINNLVVGSHDSICATLNSKQICLPSGDIIWNRGTGSGSSGGSHGGSGVHDNNHWFRGGTTEQFITFFNLVVGGFILYKCLLSLFNSVHKLLDPANSWVGVMRL